MLKKAGFGLVWLSLLVYAFFLSPPEQLGTNELIQNLVIGQWDGINPVIIALFNIMGVWPAIYACLLFSDGRNQKIPAWPFVLLSFGVGAFGLLPYLALRKDNPTFLGKKNFFIKLWDARLTGILLTLTALALLTFGLRFGNWSDFVHQWQTNRFIHVMSLDFCLLAVLFPAVLGDDMAQRGLSNQQIFIAVAAIPLLGPLLYLCFRPSLQETNPSLVSPTLAS